MNYNIHDFVQLIAQLRNPKGGCPWDLKQNYQTMIPCLTEETYEVIDAIQKENFTDLREELGDLLLQVVFLSQLANEEGRFTFDDVVQDVAEKIVRRHSHVFGDKFANDEKEALQNWNAMKSEEAKQKGHESILDNVPQAFPALMRAEKLQKRCAKVGFDWNDAQAVFAKVEEELAEVREVFEGDAPNQKHLLEEVGDLLFAAVNLSRHVNCQAEESLRLANLKFERRFRAVEQKLKAQNRQWEDTSLIEMDVLWDEVKQEEKFSK